MEKTKVELKKEVKVYKLINIFFLICLFVVSLIGASYEEKLKNEKV